MPIYEYICGKCHAEFELLVRGDTTPECPECRSRRLQKQLSVPAAPSHTESELPVCQPPGGAGCGLPACQSRCQFE